MSIRGPLPEPIDLTAVRTHAIGQRTHKVTFDRFARPAAAGRSVAELVAALPNLLAGADFVDVVAAIAAAHRAGRPVIVGLGAHVIKCGLAPVLTGLMERRVVTALALNGSGAIHDVEVALFGETSEDVGAGLADGTFGMVRETGEFMAAALEGLGARPEAGMGELLGARLAAIAAPYAEQSLLATAHRLGVPVTVHVAIGTDTVHMHPNADGAAIGRASHNDFRLLAAVVRELRGGVYLNAGSAVVLPEVFLKAFTVAQNLGAGLGDFLTVNLDMIAHYRPGENVVRRPAAVGGRGVTLLGRHELMLPLLAHAVLDAIER